MAPEDPKLMGVQVQKKKLREATMKT